MAAVSRKLEMSPNSKDFMSSAHIFPEDEAIAPEEYALCCKEKYVSSVATVVGAAESYGLDIDSETFERWKRISVNANLLDVFLDESSDRDYALDLYLSGVAYFRGDADYPRAPDFLDPRLETSIKLMYNSVAVMPRERIDSMLDIAGMIGLMSRVKSQCGDINSYIALLKEEGRISGLLVSESVSDYVRSQPDYEYFARWAVSALEFGTLQDSFKDLENDSKTGLTRVEFNVYNSLKLAFSLRRSFSALTRRNIDRSATIDAVRFYRKFIGLSTLKRKNLL